MVTAVESVPEAVVCWMVSGVGGKVCAVVIYTGGAYIVSSPRPYFSGIGSELFQRNSIIVNVTT